ncbi:hypothetical protein [Mucilaginibacter aquaedulcis]|uniref:hypothetical protein n=1 Tax=Mucilaginibacter aquaedulcis TaxID=1187081 RepID=UPI0025B4CBF2|nr:hypothetical protein [Mucilaginibacter aquaedulcis]MDN3550930.1 hypothetical protein [Mucilaginibacter aquaedulcis]
MKAQPMLITLLISLSLVACKKDKAKPVGLSGTYSGKLYSTSPGVTQANAQLVISNRNYTAAVDIPFGGGSRGTYMVNGNEITFTDSLVHTANFDWGLLLNGKYTSTTKGDSLILVKTSNNYNYTYRLKKQ